MNLVRSLEYWAGFWNALAVAAAAEGRVGWAMWFFGLAAATGAAWAVRERRGDEAE